MKILVVGAGIAGLTFVRALQYFHMSFACPDYSIDIIDQASSFKDGTGIVLHPNGLYVLDILGLFQTILPFTHEINAITTSNHFQEATMMMEEVWGEGKRTQSILRKDLHAVLSKIFLNPRYTNSETDGMFA